MRLLTVKSIDHPKPTIALQTEAGLLALASNHADLIPADLHRLIKAGPQAMRRAADIITDMGDPLEETSITYLPPITNPGKIICVGLNYLDHSMESNISQPEYPTIFFRAASSLVGHKGHIVRPAASSMLDYEGELVAYVGKRGRHIPRSEALEHVVGYSIGNEGTLRDFQFRTTQWTIGKNFDSSGSVGPIFVSADELPGGAAGLNIETRLNGSVVQSANTIEMIFDLATVVSVVSQGMTLEPGDAIFTGTPSGVGAARKPPLFMKPGDVVEVEIQGIGVLKNKVVGEISDTGY